MEPSEGDEEEEEHMESTPSAARVSKKQARSGDVHQAPASKRARHETPADVSIVLFLCSASHLRRHDVIGLSGVGVGPDLFLGFSRCFSSFLIQCKS